MNTPTSAFAREMGIGEDEAVGALGLGAALSAAIGAMVGDRYGRPQLGAAVGFAATLVIELALIYRAQERSLARAEQASPPDMPVGGFTFSQIAPRPPETQLPDLPTYTNSNGNGPRCGPWPSSSARNSDTSEMQGATYVPRSCSEAFGRRT